MDPKLTDAMRNAVHYQIADFKNSHKLVCELCKSEEASDIEADHSTPKFRELRDQFLQGRRDSMIPTTFNKNTFNSADFKEEDGAFRKHRCEFHLQKANLRLLCKTCNSKNR